MADEERGVLARWSQRKRDVAREETLSPVEPEEPAVEAEESEEDEEAAFNRAAAEAVDLDALGYESDFSVFFRRGVPAALQSAARAKLWRSSPVLANLDQMNEYDEDFASRKLILKSFKSAWQAGRGYLDKVERVLGDTEVAATDVPGDAVVPPGARPREPEPPALAEEREDDALAEAAEGTPEVVVAEAHEENSEDEARRVPLRARLDLDAFGDEDEDA